jgi:cell division protein FtsL
MVRRKFKSQEILLGLAALVFVIGVVTFYIWHQVESVRLGYEINQLETEIASLKKEVKNLEVQKSEKLSLDRVERISKQKLGLQAAKAEQIIRRSPNKNQKPGSGSRQ